MAARLWTHGFDCFAPPQAVVYHLWTRDHRPNFAAKGGGAKGGETKGGPNGRETTTGPASAAVTAALDDDRDALRACSQRRARHLLGIGKRVGGGGGGGGGGEEKSAADNLSDTSPPHLMELDVYGLGEERSLSSFEEALGVSFGGGAGGKEGPGPHRPKMTRADARWGGQPPELFNETAEVNVASLLAAFAAR